MTERPAGKPNADIRMRGFAKRSTVEAAWAWLDSQQAPLPAESVSLHEAAGRVLAEDVVSNVDVPGFDRAMMDGYAVVAADTVGASATNRKQLAVVGQSLPGESCAATVTPRKAVRIMTGAPLPEGADAVIPVELVKVSGESVLLLAEVATGKHVGKRGEDVQQGAAVLSAARRLRPQDVGVLSSVGVSEVKVVRRPRVRIVVTGNELLPPGSVPQGFQITDANSPMLQSLVARDGGLPLHPGIVPDEPHEILAALRDDCDLVLVSGGSSVGQEDHVPRLLAEHGELAIHGIAMRPASPAGMGRLDNRLVFLLPGNPVSCLCAYDFFAGRAIRALGRLPLNWPYQSRRLPLAEKLVSKAGRVDYARVAIEDGQVKPIAISGASNLSSTVRADGFVVVPADVEGYPPESEIDVFFY